jgi:hypothetical protein
MLTISPHTRIPLYLTWLNDFVRRFLCMYRKIMNIRNSTRPCKWTPSVQDVSGQGNFALDSRHWPVTRSARLRWQTVFREQSVGPFHWFRKAAFETRSARLGRQVFFSNRVCDPSTGFERWSRKRDVCVHNGRLFLNKCVTILLVWVSNLGNEICASTTRWCFIHVPSFTRRRNFYFVSHVNP